MPKQPLPKAHEILSIIHSLEVQLRHLDRVGAGIAAIHVNAAVEQLRDNLAIVNDNHASEFGGKLFCMAPVSPENQVMRIHTPRD